MCAERECVAERSCRQRECVAGRVAVAMRRSNGHEERVATKETRKRRDFRKSKGARTVENGHERGPKIPDGI